MFFFEKKKKVLFQNLLYAFLKINFYLQKDWQTNKSKTEYGPKLPPSWSYSLE